MKLSQLVDRAARNRPDSPAVSDGNETLSWATVRDMARTVRLRVGDATGTRVALCGDPGVKALSFVVGLLTAGASVALLASADLGRTELALDLWSADAWVAVDPTLDVDQFDREIDGVAKQLRPVRHRRSPFDAPPAVVFSTSGSTGNPRLVTCPDERFTAVSQVIAGVLGLTSSDRILSASPPHFDYGFNQFVLAASSGACLVQGDYLSMGRLLRADQQPVTVLASGPSQLRMIATMPDAKVGTDRIRMVTSTGAPFPVEIADHLLDLWPMAEVRSMYGMTECKRVSISTHAQFCANPSLVGHPIPSVKVTVDDVTGELLVATPHLMAFDSAPSGGGPRVLMIDDEPVLATGDVGRVTDDGQIEILGRLSQFAKIRDVRVSLAECEQVAVRHPDVREVAATSRDDQLFLWCEPVGLIDETNAREDIRRALVGWSGIDGLSDAAVGFLSHLPRLPNGKLDRPALSRL